MGPTAGQPCMSSMRRTCSGWFWKLLRRGRGGAEPGTRACPSGRSPRSSGRHLNLPVASIPRDEAEAHFGFLGAIVAIDNPTSSALTQERLGWRPTHPGLIADLDEGHYFATQSA